MELSDFDLSVIHARADGSYVVNRGEYHVPDEGEWEGLWKQVDAYAREHPEAVQPEPEDDGGIIFEVPAQSTEERLDDIENALVELASIIAGGE